MLTTEAATSAMHDAIRAGEIALMVAENNGDYSRHDRAAAVIAAALPKIYQAILDNIEDAPGAPGADWPDKRGDWERGQTPPPGERDWQRAEPIEREITPTDDDPDTEPHGWDDETWT
jgi:hypothetical protein